MIKFLLPIAFFLLASAAQAQHVNKCDMNVLRQVDKWMGTLSPVDVREFFLTFGYECRSNPEYSEWSNELLFKMLQSQTELTIRVLEKHKEQFALHEILYALSYPVGEGLDINSIIVRVEKLKVEKQLKVELVDKLNLAAGRM